MPNGLSDLIQKNTALGHPKGFLLFKFSIPITKIKLCITHLQKKFLATGTFCLLSLPQPGAPLLNLYNHELRQEAFYSPPCGSGSSGQPPWWPWPPKTAMCIGGRSYQRLPYVDLWPILRKLSTERRTQVDKGGVRIFTAVLHLRKEGRKKRREGKTTLRMETSSSFGTTGNHGASTLELS